MVLKTRLFAALLLALAGLMVPPAAAQGPVVLQGPLLVRAAAFPLVVRLPPNTLGAFELQLVLENISRDRRVTLRRVSGSVTFRGGLTESFGLYDSSFDPQGGLTLPPQSGFEIAALLLIPANAPTGIATVRVTVEYDVEGSRRTAQVATYFALVRQG